MCALSSSLSETHSACAESLIFHSLRCTVVVSVCEWESKDARTTHANSSNSRGYIRCSVGSLQDNLDTPAIAVESIAINRRDSCRATSTATGTGSTRLANRNRLYRADSVQRLRAVESTVSEK